MILIVLFTIFVVSYKTKHISSKYNINDNKIIGIVTNIKKTENGTILTVTSKENVVVYYNNMNLNLGDKVRVIGKFNKLEDNTIFNLFNYRKYMLSKKTYFSIKATKIDIVKRNKNIFYKIKNFIIDIINKRKSAVYLNTFLLGNNSMIDENVNNSYKTNGINHLFCISGMHITLISSLILFVLNKIKKNKFNYLFVILFLIFFLFLTNFTPSVMRTTFLFIFIYLNNTFKLNLSIYKIFIYVLCLNLLINPYNIYNTGFIFSYTISFYLIIFAKFINKHKNYIYKIFITSFIAFLVSIPILINNYFSINIMSVLNNIIFVPLISFIIFPLSLLALIFKNFDIVYSFILNGLESLSLFISSFKFEIILCKINWFVIIVYYIVINLVLYKLYKGKYRYIFLIIILILIHNNINYIRNNPYVTFIDVNQGDSSLIHLPHNKGNILIDTGGKFNYDISKNIINYLKSEGIKYIDYLIITHGDYDHMGSSLNLINNFKINTVIFNNDQYNELELKLIKTLKEKGIKYYNNINDINIDKYKLQFLNTRIYDNENDNSNVVYFNYNNYKFLFMGDASINKEEDILNKYNLKDINFLKVGHHGSSTSSSKKFIDSINPKYSIISVGENNRYGHPKKIVLDILKNSKIFRTDLNGSIKIKLNGNTYSINTCKA